MGRGMIAAGVCWRRATRRPWQVVQLAAPCGPQPGFVAVAAALGTGVRWRLQRQGETASKRRAHKLRAAAPRLAAVPPCGPAGAPATDFLL